MSAATSTLEIFLHQGEVFFGESPMRIRTVLGSCVAITMWQPDKQMGGMCHFMLPSRHRRSGTCDAAGTNGDTKVSRPSRLRCRSQLDGKYADEAMEIMLLDIDQSGCALRDFQVKLFGGGNMFPTRTKSCENHVGLKNIVAVRQLLARHGVRITAEHVGGAGHRNLIFDIGTGHVWMRHQPPSYSPCETCEVRAQCLLA